VGHFGALYTRGHQNNSINITVTVNSQRYILSHASASGGASNVVVYHALTMHATVSRLSVEFVAVLAACVSLSAAVMGKSQIKPNHDVNQMKTVTDSIVYARNVISVNLA